MGVNRDAARLYHLHSSYVRGRLVDRLNDLSVDDERRPFRFRTYPGSRRVALPGRDFQLKAALGTVLRNRRSVRNLRLRPLDLARVGRLLYSSYGVTGYRRANGETVCRRPCPSAGGLYPLELYVATQQVRGLPDGIYHYDARAHELEVRRPRLNYPELAEKLFGQDARETVLNANLVIAIAAIFERTMWKYGERGYRYVWLEAGHLGQNLCLAATALGLGPVNLGGFFDEELNRFLDLPSGEEDLIYLICIGQARETRRPARQ